MSLLDAVTISFLLTLAARGAYADAVEVTPHDSYSSSVGVLGCKINTNRVAYWPGDVDCNNICVKLTYSGRSVHLLRIDQSGGAYDISYDAWNYLQTGESATTDPISGGTVAMEYEEVDASECESLIHTTDSKLPLSASNSMNFLTSCLDDSSSWVAQNYVLYNICDSICSLGYDEVCTLDLSVSNQASCDHTLGLTTSLTTTPVYNIEYPSGKAVNAATSEEVSASVALADDGEEDGSSSSSDSSSSDSTTSSAAAAAATTFSTSSTSSPAATQAATTTTPVAEATTTAPAATTTSSSSSPSTTTSSTISNSPGVFAATSETLSTLSTATTSRTSSTSTSTSTTGTVAAVTQTTSSSAETTSATNTTAAATTSRASTTFAKSTLSSSTSTSTSSSAASSSSASSSASATANSTSGAAGLSPVSLPLVLAFVGAVASCLLA